MKQNIYNKYKKTVKTQPHSRESLGSVDFHSISSLGSLLWNIPLSTTALDMICWQCWGALSMLELEELKLSSGPFFHYLCNPDQQFLLCES